MFLYSKFLSCALTIEGHTVMVYLLCVCVCLSNVQLGLLFTITCKLVTFTISEFELG